MVPDTNLYNYRIVFPSFNLRFIDTPKCACSSAKDMLFRQEYQVADSERFNLGHRHWMLKFPNCIDSGVESENYKTFQIVRNPYQRLYSAYINIFKRRLKRPETFNDFISLLPFFINYDEFDFIYNHFKPCNWFRRTELKNEIYTFKIEELGRLVTWLTENNVDCNNFSVLNASPTREKEQFSESLTEKSLSIINNLFTDDFKLGDYVVEDTPSAVVLY